MIESSSKEPARLFDLVYLAESFQEVAIDVIRCESTDFLSRWYRASKGEADLTIWWDGEKRVVKQQLCLYGQVVEWNPIHGTRTGMVVEREARGAEPGAIGNEAASEIIHFDSKCQTMSIQQAVDFIGLISVIQAEDRSLLAYNFRESPRLHKNARERALKTWAPIGTTEIFSAKRSDFWKGLSDWLFGK